MLTFVVCLLFNAHPDAWLSDEQFDRTSLVIGQFYHRFDGPLDALAEGHRIVAFKVRTDLNDASAFGVSKIVRGFKQLEELHIRLRKERAAQRLDALTRPAEYIRFNRPWGR
jgi:hypothetical protein